MELHVLEQSDERVTFALDGAGHTFSNNLKHELYMDENVDVAAYKVDHPLTGTPTFIVQKDKKAKFEKILADAAKRIKDANKEFASALKKL